MPTKSFFGECTFEAVKRKLPSPATGGNGVQQHATSTQQQETEWRSDHSAFELRMHAEVDIRLYKSTPDKNNVWDYA